MSSIIDAIFQRRSIYPVSFSGERIDDKIINRLLEAANQAPSHKKTNPWRFKVVTDDGLKRFASFFQETYKAKTAESSFDSLKSKKLAQKVLDSSHVLIISMQLDPTKNLPEWEEVAATSCAVQNLWLACEEYQVGGYWSSPTFYMSDINNFVKLEENEKCLGFFYLGTPKDDFSKNVDKGRIEDKVEWLRK